MIVHKKINGAHNLRTVYQLRCFNEPPVPLRMILSSSSLSSIGMVKSLEIFEVLCVKKIKFPESDSLCVCVCVLSLDDQ